AAQREVGGYQRANFIRRRMPRRSGRYLHGSGLAATENDIETIPERMTGHGGVPVKIRDQAIARVFIRNAIKDRIKWQQGISRKIHLRHQTREQPSTEKRKMNVRRAPGIRMILPRV